MQRWSPSTLTESVDRDGPAARAAVREPLAFYKSNGPNTLTDVHGSSDLLAGMIARGGYESIVAEMPESWIDELTIREYHAAGADSVALFPMPTDRVDGLVELTAAEVLPRL